MFGGKELDVNVRKVIASPEDAAQQDDDDAAAGESDSIRRQQHFNTFNISTRVRVRVCVCGACGVWLG
jgi:hypothetical protein